MIGVTGKPALGRALFVAAALAVAAGCAKSPESIAPAYISEMHYRDWTCDQLGQERSRLAAALETASAQQEQARSNDIAGVILLGLPVASLSGDNIAPEVARLKGERAAVDRTLRLNDCAGATVGLQPAFAYATEPEPTLVDVEPVACGPATHDDAGRPELRKALAAYYKKHPIQRSQWHGTAYGLRAIEALEVVDIQGNVLVLDVTYRAMKVHHGVAKVEVCNAAYTVLSFA